MVVSGNRTKYSDWKYLLGHKLCESAESDWWSERLRWAWLRPHRYSKLNYASSSDRRGGTSAGFLSCIPDLIILTRLCLKILTYYIIMKKLLVKLTAWHVLRIRPSAGFTSCTPNMIILPQQCRKTITDIIMAKIAGRNYCMTSVTYPNTCCYTRDPPNASQGMHDSKGYIRGPQFSFPAINNRANNNSYSHVIYRIKFQMTPYAVVEFEDDHSIAIIHTVIYWRRRGVCLWPQPGNPSAIMLRNCDNSPADWVPFAIRVIGKACMYY